MKINSMQPTSLETLSIKVQRSTTSSKSRLKNCRSGFLRFDSYGLIYQTRIRQDSLKLRSLRGSLCTIFLWVILIAYSYRKAKIFYNRERDDTTQHLSEYEINEREVFSIKNGFNIAVALTTYDSSTEMELDPSYGQLRFRKSTWGVRDDGTIYWDRVVVPTHVCSRIELGLDQSAAQGEAKFMPIVERERNYLVTFQRKFLCLDDKDLSIYGDFTSAYASQLTIDLVKCKG